MIHSSIEYSPLSIFLFVQVLVKDLLRKYPQWSQDCIAVVGNISTKNVQEPKAKAALIWMLGEYSIEMQDAPYALESLIENWDEEHSPEVVSSPVLNLCGKHLFFKYNSIYICTKFVQPFQFNDDYIN